MAGTDDRPRPRGPAALHGRRKGHALRAGQAQLLATMLPRLRLPGERLGGAEALAALFPAPVRDVWLEIGFGGGEHLASQAMARPDIGFIGCEPFVNGLAKLVAAVEGRGLGNIRVDDGDAMALLGRLPSASIGRAFLLYPDPWPKRRQRKRRFIGEESLAALARILKPGAELRFATDIDDYTAWTLARVAGSPDFDWTAQRADDWRLPWPDWPGTRYEAKALQQGRRPAYLSLRRR